MSERLLVLWLPESDAAPVAWELFTDGTRIDGGSDATAAPPVTDDLRIVAVTPAAAVTLHWVALPDLASAQARAAAALLAAEATAGSAVSLHVALAPADGDGRRAMALVDRARMAGWLARAAASGHDPHLMVPAPLLLPAPELGFVRGSVGGEAVVRGIESAFAEDDIIAPMILGDALVADASVEPIGQALAHCPIDLRQGIFARRRRFAIDWRLVRRMAMLAGVALLLVLATAIVRIARYDFAADAAEARVATLARQALPPGARAGDPARGVSERLAAMQGAGGGFAALSGAVIAGVQTRPDVDLVRMDYDDNGTMRFTLAAADAAALSAVANAIQNDVYRVDVGQTSPVDGRTRVELTVRAR